MIDNAFEWFVEYMDSGALPYMSAGWFLFLPVSIVVHELGHAVVALACTQSHVEMRVGPDPGLIRGRIGRLAYSIDPRWGRKTDDPGMTAMLADVTPSERIAYSLGGPAANVLLAVFLTPLASSFSGPPRHLVAGAILVSVCLAVLNLVSRETSSDGRMALAAIRGEVPLVNREPPLTGEIANALGRWLALYTNMGDRRFSDQRSFLFGIAPLELGFDPRTSFANASRYWSIARAGWCWREVRPAPAEVLANLPENAWRSRSLEGLRGLDLAAAATVDVARGRGADADPHIEEALVATIEPPEGASSVDDEDRFAFQFGVALYDVERVMEQHGQRYW
jgi:peptidase M50-like protein